MIPVDFLQNIVKVILFLETILYKLYIQKTKQLYKNILKKLLTNCI